MTIKTSIEKVLNEYNSAYTKMWAEQNFTHPLLNYFNGELKSNIASIVHKYDSRLLVDSSTGMGRVTGTPWIAILDPRITSKASSGTYIVYLFNKDTKCVYLSLACSINEAKSKVEALGLTGKEKTKKVVELIQEEKKKVLESVRTFDFNFDNNARTGKEDFDKTIYLYKKYSVGNIPEDEILERDLSNMIKVYSDFYNYKNGIVTSVDDAESLDTIENVSIEETEIEQQLSTKEAINQIKQYIQNKGFSYNDNLIENFYLSLKSKPFVILAGTSGTGKTRLVKLFASAIEAEYKLVPVRPDWSDSSDLFGHVDLNGKFVPGAIIDFVKEANDHPSKPYMLCLDEMNLARVEYYLSDFLSIIETRDYKDGKIISDPLIEKSKYGTDIDALNKYGELCFPQNLYIVGTVNMDETTFPFSKKVLDRANTIEFDYVNLIPNFVESDQEVTPLNLSNSFLITEYLLLNQCKEESEFVTDICTRLEKINGILKISNAHIGYRVRDEIVFYLLNNKNSDLLSFEEAFDNLILQKILPRIQGSSYSIKTMLCKLFKELVGNYEDYTGESDSDKMKKMITDSMNYKKSAEKIQLMVSRFEEDNFTSYWL